jgi:predicted dehydrogenase
MKVGIMSFAHHHGEAYIQNLLAIPQIELLGVADDESSRGQRIAAENGTRYFPTYEGLIEAGPDGVIICSENNKHRPLVELAAAGGSNILCEKPIATTVEDAQAIVDACNRAGVLLMTAFPMRFSTPLVEVKNWIDAGELGEIYCFNATNQGALPKVHREWFADKELAGGGALMDHTVHLLDIMRWYLESEVSEVYAQINHIFHADEVDVETGGLELITFENGTFASIDSSWSRPPYWPSWGGLAFEMITERGAVLVDAFRQNLTIYRQDWQRAGWTYWGSDANQAMVNEFIAAIQDNRQPFVSGYDGLKAVEVVEAAYLSAECGQPLSLPLEKTQT